MQLHWGKTRISACSGSGRNWKYSMTQERHFSLVHSTTSCKLDPNDLWGDLLQPCTVDDHFKGVVFVFSSCHHLPLSISFSFICFLSSCRLPLARWHILPVLLWAPACWFVVTFREERKKKKPRRSCMHTLLPSLPPFSPDAAVPCSLRNPFRSRSTGRLALSGRR